MDRKVLVVGDPPASGGRVLPYDGPMLDLFGHRAALIGGRAYCEGCNSVGIIAKAGGPRRPQFISEVALEGDVVVCHCPVPQPLVATLQFSAIYDDGVAAAVGAFSASLIASPGWFSGDSVTVAASKKIVDAAVNHPSEAEQTENICPNMTNRQFCDGILGLRDKAVSLIAKKRLPELARWNEDDMSRVKEWFGVADQPMREYLQKGLASCESVLRGFTCKNFVRLTDEGKELSCIVPKHDQSTIAMVCKPDIATRTIAINVSFCTLRDVAANLDSQLSTLIHEVTHFNDTFGSLDTLNHLSQSRSAAKTDPKGMKTNADSITGYVVWDEVFYAS
ncbi:M35 family metallo-endopeptidase [Variovorax sp. ZT5P49]|uniref:M35 family metallo-endopeptidase n=2 Tax=unclassified Variovorax TaxID=663243 RepID=UPI003F48FA6F